MNGNNAVDPKVSYYLGLASRLAAAKGLLQTTGPEGVDPYLDEIKYFAKLHDDSALVGTVTTIKQNLGTNPHRSAVHREVALGSIQALLDGVLRAAGAPNLVLSLPDSLRVNVANDGGGWFRVQTS